MELNTNMQARPTPSSASWRRGAVQIFSAAAIVLAVIWGETWAIERSADFVPTLQSSVPDAALGHKCATNAVPIATLH